MNNILDIIKSYTVIGLNQNFVFRYKRFVLKYNIEAIDESDYKRWFNELFSVRTFPDKLIYITDRIDNNIYVIVDLGKTPRKDITSLSFNWNDVRPILYQAHNSSKWKTIIDYLPRLGMDINPNLYNDDQQLVLHSNNRSPKVTFTDSNNRILVEELDENNSHQVSRNNINNLSNQLKQCTELLSNIAVDKIVINYNINNGEITNKVDNSVDNSVNTKTKYKYTCNDDFMIPPPLLNEDEAFKKCPSSKVLKPFYIERKTDPMLHTIIEDKSTSIFRYVGVYPVDNLPTDAYSMYDVRVDDYRELIGVLDDKNYKMACIAYRNKANKYLSRYRYNLVDQDLFDEMCQLELWWTLIIPDYHPQPLTSLEDLERETIQESDWFKQQLVKFTDFKSLKTPFSLQGPIAHMRLTNIVLWKLREWLIEMGVPQECFNETRW